MAKQININALTGEITEVDVADIIVPVEVLREQKLQVLYGIYDYLLSRGFISYANGSAIQYGYDMNMQIIYSKWANVLALDPNKASVMFSIPDSQIVTLTRDQFIQFMNDAETFELNLFNSRMELESQIKNAPDVDTLNKIEINL
jgi:hypothetical protein